MCSKDLLLRLLNETDPERIPTCVIVAAHPDDETVSASYLLARVPGIRIVHVTDGAPRDLLDARAHGHASCAEYAKARRQELLTAVAHAGVQSNQLSELRVPDQEAALQLPALCHVLARLLRKWGPGVVVTHPYEGGHPDHDSASFISHAACHLLARTGESVPVLIEMTSYHERQGLLNTLEFANHDGHVYTIEFSEEHRTLKRKMMDAFTTQRSTLSPFPVGFERFRLAPSYDFGELPNQGRLLYEQYAWGLTGARWRELARAALADLGIRGPI